MRPRGLIAISLLTAMSAGVAFSALGPITSVPWGLALTVLGVFWVLLPVLFLSVIAWDHLQSHIPRREVPQDPSDGPMAPARR
jgi:hypothetical protein